MAEKGEAGPGLKVGGTKVAGKKKNRTSKKKRNGHKAKCMCPICKNMRKGRKTRKQ